MELKNCKCSNHDVLVNALIANGYIQADPDKLKLLGIVSTEVFVTIDGRIATINQMNNNFYKVKFRDIKPMYKGISSGTDSEIRVTIDSKFIAVHILVAIAYPWYCGEWSKQMQVHHIDGDHTKNVATNLICLSPMVHRKVHTCLRSFIKQGIDINRHLNLMIIEGCILGLSPDDILASRDLISLKLRAKFKEDILNGEI